MTKYEDLLIFYLDIKMKLINLSFLLISFFSATIFAVEGEHNSAPKIKYSKATKRIGLSKKDRKDVLEVLKANEVLHAGFYTYKRSKIMQKVEKVNHAISKIKSNKTKRIFTKSQKWLEQISTKLRKKENYKKYNMFSKELIKIILKYNVGSDYNIYYCPMLKMTWIQNTKTDDTVLNPYASYMPHCGQRESDF